MTFKVAENINSKKFIRTLTFKKAYDILLEQRKEGKRVNVYEFITPSFETGYWKYMTPKNIKYLIVNKHFGRSI